MPKHEEAMAQAMQPKAQEPEAPKAAAPEIDPNVIALAKVLAQEMLAGQRAINMELVDKQADAYAGAMKTAMKPENAEPPLMSDFNPKGDRDFPRPELPYPFSLNGAEMPAYLLTVEEIDLLMQLTPGEYNITKTDDTVTRVAVVPTLDQASGVVTKMTIWGKFGGKNKPDEAQNWPPMRVWLAEMLGVPAPVRPTVKRQTGKLSATLGTRGGENQTIQSLEAALAATGRGALGPTISRDVNAMLSVKADALESLA